MVREFEVVFKDKDGVQYVRVAAENRDKAEQQALEHQYRRKSRIALTFARLDTEKPRDNLGKARLAFEVERRKRDLGRYERQSQFKVVEVREAP